VLDNDKISLLTRKYLGHSLQDSILMASDRGASETSPLLGHRQNGNIDGTIDSIPVTEGLTTDSAGTSGDLERRESVDQSRAAQFQGVPEIHEKLKYILPAISVGVWLPAIAGNISWLISRRYSSPQPIRPSSSRAMEE
jgi:hypothetical protein